MVLFPNYIVLRVSFSFQKHFYPGGRKGSWVELSLRLDFAYHVSRVMLVKTTESPEMENAQKLNDTFNLSNAIVYVGSAQVTSLFLKVNKLLVGPSH